MFFTVSQGEVLSRVHEQPAQLNLPGNRIDPSGVFVEMPDRDPMHRLSTPFHAYPHTLGLDRKAGARREIENSGNTTGVSPSPL